jgi:hypothetical protein
MPTIAIRVSDEDHKLFTALAEREFMPLSILVRRVLHAEAVRAALILDPIAEARRALRPDTEPTPAKPAVERLPIPQGTNELRDAVYTRVNKGESLPDVAESYGIPLDVIKAMYKRAKESAESQSEAAPNHEIISKEVLNDPEQMRVINDAKFAALMANMQEKPPAP